MVSYAFSHNITEYGDTNNSFPIPFEPKGYSRGRSSLDKTHILSASSLWEVPVGRGRHFGSHLNPVTNAILGGWQLSSIYSFLSGTPLVFNVPGNTLGNGFGTRPNQVGNPKISNPSAAGWFDSKAFEAPPLYTFGNSGIGLMDGPGFHGLDLSLMKNVYFRENKYVQLRWEMFNATNHVNLSNPVTTMGLATTGQIFSAGAARTMQFGLKVVF
jgi:hypothetical protein